ncbi:MAG: multicopper oxidase domain-containing protein, partial [Gemmatimonadaceae bacterium]
MRISTAIRFLAFFPLLAMLDVPPTERVVANDNRTAAGVLSNGVLTIHLEAREGEWFPDAETARGVVVRAFAERGKRLSAPGPMIRVTEGVTIDASVTNSLGEPLIMRGLATHNDIAMPDSTIIVPGETREFHFAAGRAGTYYYHATTGTRPDLNAVDA